MKKLIVAGLAIGLLAGCGNEESINEAKDKAVSQNQEGSKKESKHPFPEKATPTGDAKITVSTPAGNSENGNAPVLFADKNTFMDTVGADLSNFQGDKQTFIYLNKIFQKTYQVGERAITSVELNQDEGELKPGVYTVSAVQFEGDDPKGKVLNFTEAKFEIKEKK